MGLTNPVPRAIAVAFFVAIAQGTAQVQQNKPGTSAWSTDTARRADGKPDLNGVWTDQLVVAGIEGVTKPDGSHDASLFSRTGGLYAMEIDGRVMRKGNRDKPLYKPEHWAKVRDLELRSLETDPEFKCQPFGVPRIGEPQQIVHQDNLIVFLYSGFNVATTPNIYRVIRLNRPHDPVRVTLQTSRGDSVGHWEGDTLVVDTVGFNDETWLTGKFGYFHSVDLHVVERFTRTGNTIKYEVTVEDPQVLMKPWVWAPRTMKLNPNPDAMLQEDYPCSERDASYTRVRG